MEYRASPSSYVVFGIIFGTPLLLISAALIRGADPSWVKAFLFASVALASAFLALSRYRLVISSDEVAYSSPLRARRIVRRAEISHADFADETGPLESPITFVVRDRAGKELRINAKVLPREAMESLVDLGSPA